MAPGETLDIEVLSIGGEALVDPVLCDVCGRDAVAPPLVRRLVHDDVVPREALARSGQVVAQYPFSNPFP